LELMNSSGNRGGPRSGLYSSQRFTNWSPHDPNWSDAQAMPAGLRPSSEVARSEGPLGIFERALSPGFSRPWTAEEVAEVLRGVPAHFLSELEGVFSMAGTTKQRRLQVLTHGMYYRNRIYLFPVPSERMAKGWRCSPKASEVQRYQRFGAQVKSPSRGGKSVMFDEASLRRFYLYDVLLHEVGHHYDQGRSGQEGERFARWFAEFQRAHLAS